METKTNEFNFILEGIQRVKPEILEIIVEHQSSPDDTDIVGEYFRNISPLGDEPLYDFLKKKTHYRVQEQSAEEMGPIEGAFFGAFGLNLLVIRDNLSEAAKLRVLVHEAAHGVLDHEGLGGHEKGREIREVEAEISTYLFLKDLGIDISHYSFPYIVKEAQEEVEEILKSQWPIILNGVTKLKEAFHE